MNLQQLRAEIQVISVPPRAPEEGKGERERRASSYVSETERRVHVTRLPRIIMTHLRRGETTRRPRGNGSGVVGGFESVDPGRVGGAGFHRFGGSSDRLFRQIRGLTREG